MCKATAPYNFISLPSMVVPALLEKWVNAAAWETSETGGLTDVQAAFCSYMAAQNGETVSGHIELEITTETPCFIGGNHADKECFFSPTGEFMIPGSTLRGMIKNLLKITSCGAMRRNEDFFDRHLYFRCLMAPNSMPQLAMLNKYYTDRMSHRGRDGKPVKDTKPGFLFHQKYTGEYFICPAEMKSIEKKTYEIQYGTVTTSKVVWDMGRKEAYCLTGAGKNKNYIRCLHSAAWQKRMPVEGNVLRDYREDKNRRGVDLLNEKGSNVKTGQEAIAFTGEADIDSVVPCFYVERDGAITAFGHGRSFRIPYVHSVGDAVPDCNQSNMVDFADALFGRKQYWGSRVFFEDAICIGKADTLPRGTIKPLLSPNPTSFQLYLQQSKKDFPPRHWDDPQAAIRGYKLYWNNQIKPNAWQANGAATNGDVTHTITPIAAHTRFQGRIRFEELSRIELGALLQVFSLEDEKHVIRYKIGQGKSLGLGSVKITARLHLDRPDRYDSDLFSDTGWTTGTAVTGMDEFLQAFQGYIRKELAAKYYSYERVIEELKDMLDWKCTAMPSWKEKIAMMSGDVQNKNVDPRYIEKAVLPSVREVHP